MPRRKTREQIKRSRAAIKGWITRRRNNPEKWGRKRVSKKPVSKIDKRKKIHVSKVKKKRVQKAKQIVRKKKRKGILLEEPENQRVINRQKVLIKRMKHEISILKGMKKRAQKIRFPDVRDITDIIRWHKEHYRDLYTVAPDLAAIFDISLREVYTLWLSPEVA